MICFSHGSHAVGVFCGITLEKTIFGSILAKIGSIFFRNSLRIWRKSSNFAADFGMVCPKSPKMNQKNNYIV